MILSLYNSSILFTFLQEEEKAKGKKGKGKDGKGKDKKDKKGKGKDKDKKGKKGKGDEVSHVNVVMIICMDFFN